jgi:hypothetical protein
MLFFGNLDIGLKDRVLLYGSCCNTSEWGLLILLLLWVRWGAEGKRNVGGVNKVDLGLF